MKKIQDLDVKWKVCYCPRLRIYSSVDFSPSEEVRPFVFEGRLATKNQFHFFGRYSIRDIDDETKFDLFPSGVVKLLSAIQDGHVKVDKENQCFVGAFTFVKIGTEIGIEPFIPA